MQSLLIINMIIYIILINTQYIHYADISASKVNTALFVTDIFHWPCLNHYAQQFPANTAPAGYTCPTCNAGIFPPQNMVSPVADKLKTLLSTVNWARAGLGLPLVSHQPLFVVHQYTCIYFFSWWIEYKNKHHLYLFSMYQW